MTIQVSWLVENRIMHWHVSGTGNPSEVRAAEAVAIHMLENVHFRIHILFDMEDLTELPPLVAYSRQKWTLPKDPRIGWCLFIGMKKNAHRAAIAALANHFRIRVRFFNTQPDALELLRCVDRSFAGLECHSG